MQGSRHMYTWKGPVSLVYNNVLPHCLRPPNVGRVHFFFNSTTIECGSPQMRGVFFFYSFFPNATLIVGDCGSVSDCWRPNI